MATLTIADLDNGQRDLQTVDAVANSTADFTTTRFGDSVLTLAGALRRLGYQAPVPYASGLNVDSPLFTVERGGVVYAPNPSQIPFTTGAWNASQWLVVQAESRLRSDLAAPDGITLVGGSVSQAQMQKSITMYGAKADGSDSKSALLAALPHVHFPLLDGQPTTYTFSSFSPGQLNGAVFSADDGVTLSFANNAPYSLYSGITVVTPVRMFARDISMPYVMTPSNRRATGENVTVGLRPSAVRQSGKLQPLNGSDVTFQAVQWPGSDSWTDASATATASEFSVGFSMSGSYPDYWRGAFVGIGPYETVGVTHGAGPSAVRGVIVRGTDGFAALYSAGGANNYLIGVKRHGQALVETPLPWSSLGQGVYSSFASENSRYSVTRVGAAQAVVKVNGKAISLPYLPDVGEIQSVGFAVYGTTGFSLSDMTIQKSVEAVYSKPEIPEIRIFGDSTAADFPGSFGRYLKGLLDGTYGVAVRDIVNFAVVGDTTAQQNAVMDAKGFGVATYVVLCMGTNDIQGQLDLSAFRSVYTTAIQKVLTAGRRPVVVVPWMWYTPAQSGGSGQPSVNYEKGAPYRGVIEALARKYGAVLVNTPEALPNPDPRYVTQSSDYSLLRDNIHQGARGYQMYASAVAQAILDDYSSQEHSVSIYRAAFGSGASSPDFQLSVSADGIVNFAGTVQFSASPSNGAVAFTLPRWCRPAVSFNIPASASISRSSPVSSYAFVQSSGVVSLPTVPAGATTFVIAGSFKQA